MGNKNIAYFRVCKFEELQHYRDRSPPWIKLYNSLLDDYEFATLDDASKFHLVAIWLLASRNSNCIPMDAKWVQRRIDAHKQVDLQQFIDAGFIEKIPEESDTTQPDSDVLAECYQDASPEGEESREEQSIGDAAPEVQDERSYTTKKGRKLKGVNLDRFERFWQAFDYRKGKAEAADAWLDLKPDEDLAEEIISGAEAEANKRPSLIQAGYTPKMAQGWLTGRRWEDEDFTVTQKPADGPQRKKLD